MPGVVRANIITPLEPAQAARALWHALRTVCAQNGDALPMALRAPALACLIAHTAHETGHWSKMHCFNFGNIKAGARWAGSKCEFRAWENLLGQRVEHSYFWRAFPDADSGALDYARFVGADTDGGGNRYRDAWEAMLAGEAPAFAHKLKAAGYYTDDAAAYARSLLGLARGYLRIATEVSSDA